MAIIDVSGRGNGGTFTDGTGATITWSSSGTHPQFFVGFSSGFLGTDISYNFSNGSGGGVKGLVLAIGGLNMAGEGYDVHINGIDMNLNTLIANGNAQVVNYNSGIAGAGDQALINGNGDVVNNPGGASEDVIYIQLNFDVTSVFLDHFGTPSGLTDILIETNICFAAGTFIKTQTGERPIEDLTAGDLVLTMDHGYQPIRWIGSSKRPATGDMAPILIRKGALGNDRDLRVSPQHRMLLQGWQAELLFGEHEVLATAKSLVNDHSIIRVEGGEVEYFHMLFDTHEIVYAEGAPSESFHPGEQGWKGLDQATRDEILSLFPELAEGNFESYGPSARMSLKHKEGHMLGQYMIKKSKDVLHQYIN